MKAKNEKPWTTNDEIEAITYMASTENRGTKKDPEFLSKAQRRARVISWLKTADKREWPEWINVKSCKIHAQHILTSLDRE